LISFLQSFDIPVNIKDLGFNEKDFVKIMKNAISTRPNRYTILNDIDMTENNLLKIYNNLFN